MFFIILYITAIYKKGKKDLKRRASILLVLSKLKKYVQGNAEFFENIFSKNEGGFGKGHNTKQCLLAMGKWKRSLDSG